MNEQDVCGKHLCSTLEIAVAIITILLCAALAWVAESEHQS